MNISSLSQQSLPLDMPPQRIRLIESDQCDLAPIIRDLHRFPHVSTAAVSRYAVEIGNAGEALFEAFAGSLGLRPMRMSPGLPFDYIIAVNSHAPRVQVKTTAGPNRNGDYAFSITRGNSSAGAGIRPYSPADFDIVALVLLDRMSMTFTTSKSQRVVISPSEAGRLAALQKARLFDCLLTSGFLTPAQFEVLNGALADPVSTCKA